MRLASVAVLLALGTGCSSPTGRAGEGEAAENVAGSSQAIAGGQPDSSDTAVVGIVKLSQGGIGSCSGTLIAPNVILTARHCVANISTGEQVDCFSSKFGATLPASNFYITTDESMSQNGNFHSVKEVVVQPNNTKVCGNDVALLVLDDALSSAEAVPRLPLVDESVMPMAEYYAVGYGQRGEGGPFGSRYRRNDLVVKCVGTKCKAGGQILAQELLGDTGVCQGDSGGPAFDLQDRVFGVASRGAMGCTLPTYEHVFAFADFIKQTVKDATLAAGVETPDWVNGFPTDKNYHAPVGASCSQPADCPTNACVDGYCTRLCSPLAACPTGYTCMPQNYCAKIGGGQASGSAAVPEETTESSCSLTSGQDPTKPIPWIVSLALAFVLRSRRSSRL